MKKLFFFVSLILLFFEIQTADIMVRMVLSQYCHTHEQEHMRYINCQRNDTLSNLLYRFAKEYKLDIYGTLIVYKENDNKEIRRLNLNWTIENSGIQEDDKLIVEMKVLRRHLEIRFGMYHLMVDLCPFSTIYDLKHALKKYGYPVKNLDCFHKGKKLENDGYIHQIRDQVLIPVIDIKMV